MATAIKVLWFYCAYNFLFLVSLVRTKFRIFGMLKIFISGKFYRQVIVIDIVKTRIVIHVA